MSNTLFQTYGVSANSSKDLSVASITNANSPYTITTEDVIFADATSGAITINMPSTTRLSPVYIRKTGTGQNVVSISSIDGGTFRQVCPGESVTAETNGSIWQSIAKCTSGYFGSITTTGGWSSNSTYTAIYWKRGGYLRADVRVALSGSPNAAALTITLPNSWSIDATKLNLGTSQENFTGWSLQRDAANTTSYFGCVQILQSSLTQVRVRNVITISNEALSKDVTNSEPFNFGNNDYVQAIFEVPITDFQE